MSTTRFYRWGLYLSVVVLLISVGVVVWPLLVTTRFWIGVGFCVGIVGTFLFSVALSSADVTTTTSYHEQE